MSVGIDTIDVMCNHEHLPCPNGQDSWDCESFCAICEGFGEYCPQGCQVDLDENGYAIYVNVGG